MGDCAKSPSAVPSADFGRTVARSAVCHLRTLSRPRSSSMQAVISSPAGRFDDLVKVAQISIEPATEAQARVTREAYRDFGKGSAHPEKLNFGDCFAMRLQRPKVSRCCSKATNSHTLIPSPRAVTAGRSADRVEQKSHTSLIAIIEKTTIDCIFGRTKPKYLIFSMGGSLETR